MSPATRLGSSLPCKALGGGLFVGVGDRLAGLTGRGRFVVCRGILGRLGGRSIFDLVGQLSFSQSHLFRTLGGPKSRLGERCCERAGGRILVASRGVGGLDRRLLVGAVILLEGTRLRLLQ